VTYCFLNFGSSETKSVEKIAFSSFTTRALQTLNVYMKDKYVLGESSFVSTFMYYL